MLRCYNSLLCWLAGWLAGFAGKKESSGFFVSLRQHSRVFCYAYFKVTAAAIASLADIADSSDDDI